MGIGTGSGGGSLPPHRAGSDVDVLSQGQLQLLRFDERGLVPAVVQQHDTGRVLMVAWMSAESLARTLQLGEAVFHSRSRDELWHKGATSGNTQRVLDLRVDCDGDTLLVLVDSPGPACHTGHDSCFHRRLPDGPDAPTAVAPGLAG